MAQGDAYPEVYGELPDEISIDAGEGTAPEVAAASDTEQIMRIVQGLLKIMPAEMIIAYLLSLPQVLSQQQQGA